MRATRSDKRSSSGPVSLCAAALSFCLLLMAGLVGVLGWHGLGAFWPVPIDEFVVDDGTRVWGQVREVEELPPPAEGDAGGLRMRVAVGDVGPGELDHRWVSRADVVAAATPVDLVRVERASSGPCYGRIAPGGSERDPLVVETSGGERIEVPRDEVVRVVAPNALGFFGKTLVVAARVWEFLTDEPRQANTAGGIFPAIFGTVLMVFLMTLFVTPLGVLAALYLREYARQATFVRVVRIAVNNLASVPSIVFGIFGLGFFVYTVGGSIDELFFPGSLPTPTFGTGGILWASLTLALLTVPVVIVATEESLAAVPSIVREGSYALGATKLETTARVVLPAALPGVFTGIILAIARAAGEVAPLMIVGMVKMARDLVIDGSFPFFHPERKFMHLGFHVYDLGFQSPDVEATKPLVYATAFLLVVLVASMNLFAVRMRNRLRSKYASPAV